MGDLFEAVPNFSEGRDQEVVEALAQEARSVAGVVLLDYSADVDHHRSVFTLMGTGPQLIEALIKMTTVAVEKIDLNQHQGEHPRMGALDVCPFIPLGQTSMDQACRMAEALAERLAADFDLPVMLYGEAASQPSRNRVADIRRGGFEGLADKLADPAWQVDYGPQAPHPSAGMTAVGARPAMVAFNVNLDTNRLDVAQAIAKKVRGSSGGFPACQALGMALTDRDLVQVSMNILDLDSLPLYRILETVRMEAARYGVAVLETELVGLAPAQALYDSAAYYLQLADFDPQGQVLEEELRQAKAD
ncbi:glutamate formimidoyltransferase [Aerococcus sanguinicola]|uniref:glutamate formimidoyltransferase n=1 Tax=Aerococcus sanguinicola TaxID=119206 RepID=A0A0X8FB73_9LACT|nr:MULTISPECIES: glutamate formimidoyltransferase [Aerococcus]AMB94160.1 glutamate formiminotransferase [Aerococcus sanguinicola]MDK7050145.1 glutamate formimidoyltransferase [Aerococcus sanguinicola]OFT93230.1 glutamate formiminotransferase [Aerococcus sp. HMSC23C02]PKZ22251.1 glutamate formimidoyltransferase [Aerococcus sanguinicola]